MKATISKVTKSQSKLTSGTAYMVCFRCDDGKSRVSWIDSEYRNFSHWKELLVKGFLVEGTELDGLVANKTGITADSYPKLIKRIE